MVRGPDRDRSPTRTRRGWWSVLGVVAALVLLLPLAARAVAPPGDADTPGVWGTHTVTFVADGATVATVEVADGGHAPRQPAPEPEHGVFDGWFVTVAGVEVEFDFDTTVVESDLTVQARVADEHVVQFLGPDGLDVDGRVLATSEVAHGDPVGEVAPDVPDVPDGRVFTGDWAVAGAPSSQPYDFTAPVVENLTLVPVLAGGFAVAFVTGGTAVEPEFVLQPDTELTEDELAAVPEPTRVGYTFDGWWADEDRTVRVTFQITDTTTLYAGWEGDEVGYDVTYWLEKPGITPDEYPDPVWTDVGGTLPDWGAQDGALSAAQLADRGNFDVLENIPATATAGSTVSGPADESGIPGAVQEEVHERLDPANVQSDPMAFADLAVSDTDLVVEGDGSTVVNVYLTRALWRIDYPLLAPGLAGGGNRCNSGAPYDVQMDVGAATYYTSPTPQASDGHRLGTFSARTKIGFDQATVDAGPFPMSQDDGTLLITAENATSGAEDCVLRGWGPQQTSSMIFEAQHTGAYADSGTVSLEDRTTQLSAQWARRTTQNLTERFPYVEAEDQEQSAPTDVLGADGTPNDPLQVSTLYNNDRSTVRVAVPPGQQVFEQYRKYWYWATNGDR